ncbi:hypothetical protein 015DV002_243 [Bacillus phage 015DV002]|nr:hypothetical protein 015DV002_243 [Bacillus phage 015DV002]
MKRRRLHKNKFNNLSEKDWKEANDISKSTRGVNGLTLEEIMYKHKLLSDFIGSSSAEGLSLPEVYKDRSEDQ